LLFYTVRYDALVTTKYFIKKSTEYLIPIYPITNDTHSTKKKALSSKDMLAKKAYRFLLEPKNKEFFHPKLRVFLFR